MQKSKKETKNERPDKMQFVTAFFPVWHIKVALTGLRCSPSFLREARHRRSGQSCDGRFIAVKKQHVTPPELKMSKLIAVVNTNTSNRSVVKHGHYFIIIRDTSQCFKTSIEMCKNLSKRFFSSSNKNRGIVAGHSRLFKKKNSHLFRKTAMENDAPADGVDPG